MSPRFAAWIGTLILVAGPSDLMAQTTNGAGAGAGRRAVAVRVDTRAPELDGRLDEPLWSTAQPLAHLVQREPAEGQPAPEATEVRFLYTPEALYVGARMFSANPAILRALVARRDRDVPSEQLIISLDTRGDHRTAYTFAITPGGVRTDYYHNQDFEGSRDYSFDPVWEARTALDSVGWTAEIRIPFTQLRYNPGDAQLWGINVVRRVPARNEESLWVLVKRNETGWASRMGRLEGIAGIPPARRLELSPYLAGNGTRFAAVNSANPFAERYDGAVRVGGDLKMGLGPNLSLDATFNPDFGQVEADPAEVNLSAFETFFGERRPFFTEGSDLLNIGRGTFYSRRIGAPPGSSGATYAETASNTTILGAGKVSGRLPSGLAVGALGAVTALERVETFSPATSAYGSAIVAPVTGYGIATARQEVGQNRSIIAASFTAVERDLDPGTPLANVLARRAYTGLVDGRLRWAGGKYDASAYFGMSHVAGDSAAILAQQRASRRYYQRPDNDYREVDPTLTSLSGVTLGVNHSKLAGNLLWDVDYTHESPGLELNDFGQIGTSDDHGLFAGIRYRQTRPGPVLHTWTIGLNTANEWNFGGTRTFGNGGAWMSATFRNFWVSYGEFYVTPRAQSDNLTRGGPLMQTPLTWSAYWELMNRRGSSTQWLVRSSGGRDEQGGWFVNPGASFSARPGTQWEVSLAPRYQRRVTPRQFVTTRTGGPAATYGTRYIFSYIDRSEIAAQLRVSFAAQPNLTIEGYIEPFASSGRYRDFGELRAARTFNLRTYGTEGTTIGLSADGANYDVTDGAASLSFPVPHFDIRSLRSNLVLRWEWQPGSTLFLVWQQNRFRNTLPTENVGPRGLGDAFGIPGDHFLAIKISYWLAVR